MNIDKDKLQDKLKRLSDELVVYVYPLTLKFPKYETYALANQIRRASISIPVNIIEGLGRETDREKKRFLYISISSLLELRYEISFAQRCKYLSQKELDLFNEKSERLGQLLFAFIKKLKSTIYY